MTAQAMYDYLVEWIIPDEGQEDLLITLDYATSLYGMNEQVIEDWCFYHFAESFAQVLNDSQALND